MNSIECVLTSNQDLLAIVLRDSFDHPGLSFLTGPSADLQFGYINHPTNHSIDAHFHNQIPRLVERSQEVLIVRKGLLRVDFYEGVSTYLMSKVLKANEAVLLIKGGHGFKVLEDVQCFYVKQGPHAGASDKSRFPGVSDADVRIT